MANIHKSGALILFFSFLFLLPLVRTKTVAHYGKGLAYFIVECSLFTNETNCTDAGCYWCSGSCQTSPCVTTTTTPPPGGPPFPPQPPTTIPPVNITPAPNITFPPGVPRVPRLTLIKQIPALLTSEAATIAQIIILIVMIVILLLNIVYHKKIRRWVNRNLRKKI